MISVVVYGRNDNYGYNLHKRAALSINCMGELLNAQTDEIIFVDYNTPDDFPTFPEAIQDTLTDRAKRLLRVLRVRPSVHARYLGRTHLQVLEPIARNVGVRRSRPGNRWILSTNTDMIFVPRRVTSLTKIASSLSDGFYHLPRFEIPESLWETLNRYNPAEVIQQVMRFGRELYLNEIVFMHPVVRFDGPGDFQLILRSDLFRIHGFHERMLVGWHVDSNIAKRLTLLRGSVSDLVDDLFAYHCDHTRQVTPAHRPGGVQNDMREFFDDVLVPELEEQATLWGLANEPIEEIRLQTRSASYPNALRSLIRTGKLPDTDTSYIRALRSAIDGEMGKPSTLACVPENYDRLGYDAKHVVPFLFDAVSSYPRDTCLGWFGSEPDLLIRFTKAWGAMGFSVPILVGAGAEWFEDELPLGAVYAAPSEIASRAHAFVFDFGLPMRSSPDNVILPQNARTLGYVSRGFRMMVRAERTRLEDPLAPPRRFIAVNAVHNRFENLVRSHIGAALTPVSTRMRQGFVVGKGAKPINLMPLFSVGGAGMRVDGRVHTIPGVAGYVVYGPNLDLDAGAYLLRLVFKSAALPLADELHLACMTVEVVSLPYIVSHHVIPGPDLLREEIVCGFSVAEELLDCQSILAVQFRLKTDGQLPVMLTYATLEEAPSTAALTHNFDWLPLMSVGEAGERCEAPALCLARTTTERSGQLASVSSTGSLHGLHSGGGIWVRSKAEGFVIFGPYWELLPGRYELAIHFERNAQNDNDSMLDDGTVVIDVLARLHFCLAQTCIPHEHLRTGIHRLEFMVPRELGREDNASGLEFRVRVTGRVLFAIGSVHTRRLGDFDWLPMMSVGEAGERCEAPALCLARTTTERSGQLASVESISGSLHGLHSGGGIGVRSKAEGFVIFGPYWELLPGRYELAIHFERNAQEDNDGMLDDGTVVIDVLARAHLCLAQVSISNNTLRSGIQRLEFVVQNELSGESSRMNVEFRVRVVGRALFTIRSVQTRKLSARPASGALNSYSVVKSEQGLRFGNKLSLTNRL